MTKKPWIVAVISTDYDLENERRTIIDFLHLNGMQVSAFEEPSFPVQEDTHSHDNCLKALKRADLAILLIKERYGGKYYLNNGISITQTEYESLTIPTIVIINQRTWDERASYRRQQKLSGQSEDEYARAGAYDAGRIDINVIQFIDQIQKTYESCGKSNWINFWKDIADLKKQLPAIMSSRSVTLIHDIVEKQIVEVRNRRTSTGLSLSLGDVLDGGYYVEQEYELKAGSLDSTDSLTEGLNRVLEEGESCIILGEAGVGKTTLIAKCFLSMAHSKKDNPFYIPAYVWLKGMNTDNSFTIEEYLRMGCERYLQKEYYPFFNQTDFRFVFFLDGFDELAEKLSRDELIHLYSSEVFSSPFIVTSRMQYADRYLNCNEFASRFSCCIRLTDWTDETAKRYIHKFCDLQKKDNSFAHRITTLLIENQDLNEVLKSPLLITILLYVIERNRLEIPETIRSRTQLFTECFNQLAQREIESKLSRAGTIPENQDLVIHWAFFAWAIYNNRLNGDNRLLISDALTGIKSSIDSPVVTWPSAVYETIFDISGEYAYGAFHEQFLEFLTAYGLAYACLKKIAPYPEFLRYVLRPEINRYFRGIVLQKPKEEQKQIIEHIKELYWKCAGNNTVDAILKRVHAVYYLSRLTPLSDMNEINRIFNSENERAVLLSLYFGVIKRGDVRREKELYKLLNSDEEYNNANRGYHLAYYDSMSSQISIPFKDDVLVSWEGSLRAFERHFASLEKEHYYLRRIELVTMRQFMELRMKKEPLTDRIIEQIKVWIAKTPPYSIDQEYQKLVEEEYQKLIDVYNEMNR